MIFLSFSRGKSFGKPSSVNKYKSDFIFQLLPNSQSVLSRFKATSLQIVSNTPNSCPLNSFVLYVASQESYYNIKMKVSLNKQKFGNCIHRQTDVMTSSVENCPFSKNVYVT